MTAKPCRSSNSAAWIAVPLISAVVLAMTHPVPSTASTGSFERLAGCRVHYVTGPSATHASGGDLPHGFEPAPYRKTPFRDVTHMSIECNDYSEALSWASVIAPSKLRSDRVDSHGYLLAYHSSRPRSALVDKPCLLGGVTRGTFEHEVVAEATEEHFLSTISARQGRVDIATRVNGLYYEDHERKLKVFARTDSGLQSFELVLSSPKSRMGTGSYASGETLLSGEAVHMDAATVSFLRTCGTPRRR